MCTKFWTTFHFLLKNSHDIRNQWKNFLGSNLRWCVSWQIESVPPSVSQLRAAIHFWLSRFECCCGVARMNIWSNRGTFYTFHLKLTSVIKNTSFLTYAKSASSSSNTWTLHLRGEEEEYKRNQNPEPNVNHFLKSLFWK